MLTKSNLTLIIISLVFLVAGFCLYGSAGHDDSHITFWASYTLKEFGEIVNYNGDRIEQSSSLLLTLLIAALATLFRADVVTAGYVSTMLSGAAAIFMTWQLAQRVAPENRSYKSSLLAALMLATSPAFLLWNTSGMESTLAALCLLWFITAWSDLLSSNATPSPQLSTIAALATLCLISVRPEMITLVAAVTFSLFIYRKFSGSGSSVPTIVFYSTVLLCVCLLIAFRYFYFGSLMPLPVSAKISALSAEKLKFGFIYILRYGYANIIFLIATPIALLILFHQTKTKKTNFYLLLSAFSLLAYCGFILLSGGDWMQMGRFLVPVLPLAAVLCVNHIQRSLKNTFVVILIIVAILGLNLKNNYDTLAHESHGTPIWASLRLSPEHQQRYSIFEQYNQEHLRDMDVIDTLSNTIGTLINKEHLPVTLMSGQSGMVFFYTAKKYFSPSTKQQVHFTDSRALIENSLLKCSLINDVEHSSQGLYFDFDKFFAKQPGLHEKCGITNPDLLYDINDMTRQLPDRMEAQGYTLIHKEGGKMIESNAGLPTNTLPAANFVMVKNTLLDDLNHPELKIIKYHEKPLIQRLPNFP